MSKRDRTSDGAHYDVLIVGAGISGIGIAWHLQQKCPDKTYAILEGRDAIGGTWDLFRYPGVRSDSDIHTLGYSFKPWDGKDAIVDGASIRNYIEDTAKENDILPNIQFGVQVEEADWCSEGARWSVTIRDKATGAVSIVTCNFLSTCTGYYSYTDPEAPEFPNQNAFKGDVIHPQFWPEDLDYASKKVVVIGSGATAMTIAPNMADAAQQVTMLQRSPTYVVSRPRKDRLGNFLHRVLPVKTAYKLTRKKNIFMQQTVYNQAKSAPEKMRKRLMKMLSKDLSPELIEAHFSPDYAPWDQRLCLIPEGDLFQKIRAGSVDVQTGLIDTFEAGGIRLRSGKLVEADIIVTATGLALKHMGGIALNIDGDPVNFNDRLTYKGLTYSGVPNLVSSWGYFNASWTMRVDMTGDFICRLLKRLDETGTDICVAAPAQLPAPDQTRPWIEGFSSGYIAKKIHLFPRQGPSAPWVHPQHFDADIALIQSQPVDDGIMRFEKRASSSATPTTAPQVAERNAAA